MENAGMWDYKELTGIFGSEGVVLEMTETGIGIGIVQSFRMWDW